MSLLSWASLVSAELVRMDREWTGNLRVDGTVHGVHYIPGCSPPNELLLWLMLHTVLVSSNYKHLS